MKENLILGILVGFVILLLLILIGWRSGFAVKGQEPSGGLIKGQVTNPEASTRINRSPVDFSESSSRISGRRSSGSSSGCKDECSLNERRCVEGHAQKCGNYDSDDCLEWGSETFCKFGCQNGNCLINGIILSIESYDAQKGEVFTLPININTFEEVYAVHLEMEFDQSIIKANKISEKYLNSEGETYVIEKDGLDNINGRIRYVSTILGESQGVSGSGILIEIEFIALESGESSLNFVKTEILNSHLEYVGIETSEGIVVVS